MRHGRVLNEMVAGAAETSLAVKADIAFVGLYHQ